MNDRISALMDGELDDKSAAQLIEALARDARGGRAPGARYHLIGDAMRGGAAAVGRVHRARRAAPGRRAHGARAAAHPDRISEAVYRVGAAASVAAVAFVGWMAFAPQTAGRAGAGRPGPDAGGSKAGAGAAAQRRQRLSAGAPGVLAARLAAGHGALRADRRRAPGRGRASEPAGLRLRMCPGLRGGAGAGPGDPRLAAQDPRRHAEALLQRHLRLPERQPQRDLAHHALRDAGGDIEKLEVMDGVPREIVRDEGHRALLPARRAPGQGRSAHRARLPGAAAGADHGAGAQLRHHASARAGASPATTARRWCCTPKDNLRYGYRLYADTASGMLLRAVTVDANGEQVEQFMFTQLTIGGVTRDMVQAAPRLAQLARRGRRSRARAPRRAGDFPASCPASTRWSSSSAG